jgi:hypothetical protein
LLDARLIYPLALAREVKYPVHPSVSPDAYGNISSYLVGHATPMFFMALIYLVGVLYLK